MSEIRYEAMDGYHGGKYGHMPLGCLRDILQMLKDCPVWRLSMDVEPVSWELLRRRDPAAYRQWQEIFSVQGEEARAELVAPSYGQPYPWTIDGESLIRHLQYGMNEVLRHFPKARVVTYAVQEPCWTSALPQLLRSMGYEQAALKNATTAWSGYARGIDAQLVNWIGPDGTAIPAVPRYACEELMRTWETESRYAKEPFLSKCEESGVHPVVGMSFQDLGWGAQPYMMRDDHQMDTPFGPAFAHYNTYGAFVRAHGELPKMDWHLTQEDICVALPWGDGELTGMTRAIRQGENELLITHRLFALCGLLGKRMNPVNLQGADEHMMLAQHHDAWICASTGWAAFTKSQVDAARYEIEKAQTAALDALHADFSPHIDAQTEDVAVYSFLGCNENSYVSIPVTRPRGTEHLLATLDGKALPGQWIPNRHYADGTVCAGEMLVYLPVYGCGASLIRLQNAKENTTPVCTSLRLDGQTAEMESDLYRIRFDLQRGGRILSFLCKEDGREVVNPASPLPFNGYRGYFPEAGRFISSDESPAEAKITVQGPLQCTLELRGCIGNVPFVQVLTLRAHDPVLHVQAAFDFLEKTQVGDPFIVDDNKAVVERHRSYHDGRFKLNACFPTAFAPRFIDKDAAFDVCRSGFDHTVFQGWDEIRHNILLSFVRVTDETQGLAVFSDHTESYLHDENGLSLTMAWAGDGGFWWRHRRLQGRVEQHYGLMPHKGTWQEADLWHEARKIACPALSARLGGTLCAAPALPAVNVLGGKTELSFAGMDAQGAILLRLFNPGADSRAVVSLRACPAFRAALVELDGRVCSDLGEGTEFSVDMPAFAVRTLRLTKGDGNEDACNH